jgi:hypothetical protein
MEIQTIAAIYLSGALATFAFLLYAGRSGFKRRVLQAVVSLAWPAYWVTIQGPRASLIIVLRPISAGLLLVLLLLLLPLVFLERRGLI